MIKMKTHSSQILPGKEEAGLYIQIPNISEETPQRTGFYSASLGALMCLAQSIHLMGKWRQWYGTIDSTPVHHRASIQNSQQLVSTWGGKSWKKPPEYLAKLIGRSLVSEASLWILGEWPALSNVWASKQSQERSRIGQKCSLKME